MRRLRNRESFYTPDRSHFLLLLSSRTRREVLFVKKENVSRSEGATMHETCPRNADTCRRRAEKGEKQPYEIGHGNIYLGQPVTLFLLTRVTRSSLVAPRRPRVQSTRPRPTGHFVVGIPGRHAPQPTSPRGRLAFYFWIRNPAMLPVPVPQAQRPRRGSGGGPGPWLPAA